MCWKRMKTVFLESKLWNLKTAARLGHSDILLSLFVLCSLTRPWSLSLTLWFARPLSPTSFLFNYVELASPKTTLWAVPLSVAAWWDSHTDTHTGLHHLIYWEPVLDSVCPYVLRSSGEWTHRSTWESFGTLPFAESGTMRSSSYALRWTARTSTWTVKR